MKAVPSQMKIDYAWTSIHDNGQGVTASDVVLLQRIEMKKKLKKEKIQ